MTMVFEDKYMFLDEFYDLATNDLDEKVLADSHPPGLCDTQKQKCVCGGHCVVRKRLPGVKQDKMVIKSNTQKEISYGSDAAAFKGPLMWCYKVVSCLNFTNLSRLTTSKDRFPANQGYDSVTIASRDKTKWLQWLYEQEQMIPDPDETDRNNPSVLCKKEHVDKSELEDYMNIEPRMRCHHHADSLFSTSSGFTNYRGVLNWLIVILLCSMGRVALENIIKYGILIKPLGLFNVFLDNPYEWRCFRLIMLTNVYILLVYWLECWMAKGKISERLGVGLCSLISLSIIIVPGVIVFSTHPNPFFSSITLAIQAVTFLKLVSYIQVNSWCRHQSRDKKSKRKRLQSICSVSNLGDVPNGSVPGPNISRELITYPDNLTLKDLYYFIMAPTLCYELNFPRSERIRKRFLAKRIAEMLFLSGLMLSLVQQWIVPSVQNSRVPFQQLNLGKMLERLLKLAVPNHLIWLIFFYWFFHSCLNTIAEVLRFGDRIFYRDWWNAENIRQFWQQWNIPVHRWAIRHLYKPLVSMGYSPGLASITVFLLSAFFHEYLVSVPLKMFRLWLFMAMLGQVPLASLTRYADQKTGNIIVWLSLIIGQPAAILMYYHDYYLANY